MNLNRRFFAIASASLCLTPFTTAAEKISRSELPPAVQKTAEEVSKGATVKAYSPDNENAGPSTNSR